jgi:hypothetical protein
LAAGLIHAQDTAIDPDRPIFAGEYIYANETQWSPNGEFLSFRHVDDLAASTHYFYSLQTGELLETEHSAFTILLTADEQEHFEAFENTAYVSPNGQYIVYTSRSQICAVNWMCHALALGDLSSGDHVLVKMSNQDGYTVKWHDDSSAFLIISYGVYGGVGGIYYVGDFQGIASNINPILLSNFGIGENAFVDISPGRRVLVRGYPGLILWDSRAPSSHQQFSAFADGQAIAQHQDVVGAAFIPGADEHLLIVNEQGIVRYHLETGERVLLNPGINATWAQWVYFSHDNQYVAVLSHPEGFIPCQIFVLPVVNDQMPQPAYEEYECRRS